MKKNLLLFLLFSTLLGCAQTKNTIVKAYAFYTIPTQGNIAVNDHGQPLSNYRDTLYTVIAEALKYKKLQWTGAWIGPRFFSVIVSPAESKEIFAGKRFEDEETIVIKTSKNLLYKLELVPGATKAKQPLALKSGEVLLEGQVNAKPFTYIVHSLFQLVSPEYQ